MYLTYCDGIGKSVAVVYDGSSVDILTRTIHIEDRSKLQIHDSNLQLIDKPDLSNFPKKPLNYRNELVMGITLEEAQSIVQSCNLSPMQKELMSWHHHPDTLVYYLTIKTTTPRGLTS